MSSTPEQIGLRRELQQALATGNVILADEIQGKLLAIMRANRPIGQAKAEAERQDRLQAYWQAVEASGFALQCARTLADQLGMDLGMHDAVMCLHERLWQEAHKLCYESLTDKEREEAAEAAKRA